MLPEVHLCFIRIFGIQKAEEKLKVSDFTSTNFRKIWEFLHWVLAPVLHLWKRSSCAVPTGVLRVAGPLCLVSRQGRDSKVGLSCAFVSLKNLWYMAVYCPL